MIDRIARLTADLVAIDSRSFRSNIPVAERIEQELAGFDVTRLDFTDPAGVPKRALIAHRGPLGGLALSGHMDTVPDTGWTTDPFDPRIEAGFLHGLGSVDMKGQVAACIVAAQGLPESTPVTLLLTTDEETTKQGALAIAQAEAARRLNLDGIIVAEPTGLAPVRGHRSQIEFTAIATGIQAHSSTGAGVNANWALIPFLEDLRAIHSRLRSDPTLQDPAYDPPFSDFNLTLDNHGTAVNVTVAKATAKIKFRRSATVDWRPIAEAVRESARRHGIALTERPEGTPPELPASHPLIARAVALTNTPARTAPYGTDASELQALAPCVILGPGTIETAHTPRECVALADLAAAVPVWQRMLAA